MNFVNVAFIKIKNVYNEIRIMITLQQNLTLSFTITRVKVRFYGKFVQVTIPVILLSIRRRYALE